MAWPAPAADLAPVVALASLSGLEPSRLRHILERFDAGSAWGAVRAGSLPADLIARQPGEVAGTARRWMSESAAIEPQGLLERHRGAGVGVALYGSPSYPVAFLDDPVPPPVVFWQGDLDHLAGMRAGMVGTRDATRYGRDVARDMAAELASSGVCVVSGLALGIDGAAHAGALAVDGAPPIAVVGGGLDRIYPRAHTRLWREVAARGVVLSEYPARHAPRRLALPGTQPPDRRAVRRGGGGRVARHGRLDDHGHGRRRARTPRDGRARTRHRAEQRRHQRPALRGPGAGPRRRRRPPRPRCHRAAPQGGRIPNATARQRCGGPRRVAVAAHRGRDGAALDRPRGGGRDRQREGAG